MKTSIGIVNELINSSTVFNEIYDKYMPFTHSKKEAVLNFMNAQLKITGIPKLRNIATAKSFLASLFFRFYSDQEFIEKHSIVIKDWDSSNFEIASLINHYIQNQSIRNN